MKISNAVGTFYEPRRIRKAAEAEAEAAITKAQAEIEITDLHRRAEQRRIEEDARYQKNMEDITAKAIRRLNENASPENMDNDWIANLFDKCRIVSDGEMQSLWARVLATEANTPGTLSKRTVNLLSDFDKSDAELFTKFCGFCWIIRDVTPLVFNTEADIYNKHGINFDTLIHLETIGLIQFDARGFRLSNVHESVQVDYYDKRLRLELPQDLNRNSFYIGTALLTKIGKELALICGSHPVDGFYEYVRQAWRQFLPANEKD